MSSSAAASPTPPSSNENNNNNNATFKQLSSHFNPFNTIPPLSQNLIRPPVHSIPLSHYELSKKPLKLQRHKTTYYIVPVTHNSFFSYSLVNKVCKMVNPDYVAVELASMDDVEVAKRQAKEQALACQLATFANRELVFIDRPIEFTRHSQKLNWQHCRIRNVVLKLWQNEQVGRDDAEYFWFFVKYSLPYAMTLLLPSLVKPLLFSPTLQSQIEEDSGAADENDTNTPQHRHDKIKKRHNFNYHEEFDRLLEVGVFDAFYTEREQYMVQQLRQLADVNPDKEQVVMAVVGQLHLPHLRFFWDRNDLLSVEDLCSFHAPRNVVPIMVWQVYWVSFMTVFLLSRAFHYYRMPAFDRPRFRAPLTFVGAAAWTTMQYLPSAATYTAHATVGTVSSLLVYTSYSRLRRWGFGRMSAIATTSVPVLGYGGWKLFQMRQNLRRARKLPAA